MRAGFADACLRHDTGDRHPEHPDRLRAIRDGLERAHGVQFETAEAADRSTVERVHDPTYLDEVESFCEDGGGRWDSDTVAVEATWEAILASAGLARWAALSALERPDRRSTPFAFGRPPGHHALADDAMGFCFVNNAAVAAAAALDDTADRVAIVDWDVHHGNGIESICYDRGDICYVSIHEADLYPGTGDIDDTGDGEGEGTNCNVPVPPGAGDADYVAIVDHVVTPFVDRYDPDLVLVSAGFDAHRRDPISRMTVSTEGYAALTDRLVTFSKRCEAGLGFILEGGYGMESLADGVTVVHETLAGRDPIEPSDDRSAGVLENIERVRETHDLGESPVSIEPSRSDR